MESRLIYQAQTLPYVTNRLLLFCRQIIIVPTGNTNAVEKLDLPGTEKPPLMLKRSTTTNTRSDGDIIALAPAAIHADYRQLPIAGVGVGDAAMARIGGTLQGPAGKAVGQDAVAVAIKAEALVGVAGAGIQITAIANIAATRQGRTDAVPPAVGIAVPYPHRDALTNGYRRCA